MIFGFQIDKQTDTYIAPPQIWVNIARASFWTIYSTVLVREICFFDMP